MEWKKAVVPTLAALVASLLFFTPPQEAATSGNAQGEIVDIFGPQPTGPGKSVKLRALISNTGDSAWAEGTEVRFRIQKGGDIFQQESLDVSNEAPGSKRWVEVSATLPENVEAGTYKLRADLVSGTKLMAKSSETVDLVVDPYAYYDNFERKGADDENWDVVRTQAPDKVFITRQYSYRGDKSLMLKLGGGGEAYLVWEFPRPGPEKLTVSLRMRYGQDTFKSGGPINFFAVFGQNDQATAFFYYYIKKKWFQFSYIDTEGLWQHKTLVYYDLKPDTWYHLTASIKIGEGGVAELSVNGLPIMKKEAAFDYGCISNFSIGHFPNDPRTVGNVYFDDVRWAQEGIDTIGRGRVSITFDDGDITQWTRAKKILEDFGYKASFYIVSDNSNDPVDTKTGVVYAMNRTQLLALQDDGHIIGSHSHGHYHMTELTNANARTELKLSKKTLENWGLNISSFCFPYGDYNDKLISMTKNYYSFAMTTDEGLNGYDAIEGKYRLLRVDPAKKSKKEIESLIDIAERTGSWLIFYYHAIGPGHKGDDYWVTTKRFKSTLKYIESKGLEVVPIEWAPLPASAKSTAPR